MRVLPFPTGPFGIGTSVRHLVDESRTELLGPPEVGAPRELMVQIWYPTEPRGELPEETCTRYIDDPGLLNALAQLMNLPDTAFAHLAFMRTHAVPGAPPADADAFPVLVFSHGRCGFRNHSTALVEELVSNGFVVATIDHTYAASGVAMPDGRRVAFDRRLLPPWPRGDASGPSDDFGEQTVHFLSQDVSFVIDELQRINSEQTGDALWARLDTTRLGVLGVSMGGFLAAEASVSDPRIRATLAMDVYMTPRIVGAGLQQPTMWITRDAGTMCLEGWSRADIDLTHETMRSVFDRLPGAGYIVRSPGMYHVDFSDGRLLSPLIEERGLSGTIPLSRALGLVADYTLAFFNKHMQDGPSRLLGVLQSDDPDVLFERRDDEPDLGPATSDEQPLSARA